MFKAFDEFESSRAAKRKRAIDEAEITSDMRWF
jgi:hypothetical protein